MLAMLSKFSSHMCVYVQAHADEATGPTAALSQAVAAATALGTVGDSEEPDNGLTLSQPMASTLSILSAPSCARPMLDDQHHVAASLLVKAA